MATKVKVNFKPIVALKSTGVYSPKFNKMLANEVIRVSDPFVPFDEGYLKNSAMAINDGTAIEYGGVGQSGKYARRLWYGDSYNFKGAPVRGSRWVDRAMAINGQEVIRAMQQMVDKGVFK